MYSELIRKSLTSLLCVVNYPQMCISAYEAEQESGFGLHSTPNQCLIAGSPANVSPNRPAEDSAESWRLRVIGEAQVSLLTYYLVLAVVTWSCHIVLQGIIGQFLFPRTPSSVRRDRYVSRRYALCKLLQWHGQERRYHLFYPFCLAPATHTVEEKDSVVCLKLALKDNIFAAVLVEQPCCPVVCFNTDPLFSPSCIYRLLPE